MKLKDIMIITLSAIVMVLAIQLMIFTNIDIAIERYLDTHSFVIENDTEFSSDEFKCILGTN